VTFICRHQTRAGLPRHQLLRAARWRGGSGAWTWPGGVTLTGIVIVNVLPDQAPDGEPLLVWALLAGRAAALFALIAGISIALQSGGRQPPTGRAMIAARAMTAAGAALALRAVMITVIGLLLGATDAPVAMQLVRAGCPDMPRFEIEYTFALAAAHPGVFLTDMLLTGF
jgi:hypothetical protein